MVRSYDMGGINCLDFMICLDNMCDPNSIARGFMTTFVLTKMNFLKHISISVKYYSGKDWDNQIFTKSTFISMVALACIKIVRG